MTSPKSHSTPRRIVLLANYRPGLEVCRYLAGREADQLVRLYLTDDGDPFAAETTEASRLPAAEIFPASALRDPDHVAGLRALEPEFLITVYWPHLLAPEVFGIVDGRTVNFHPALLPEGRGWYPHVHSIVRGRPVGVTLHAIDENADTGPIWAQREVALRPDDTGQSIYLRLQDEIVALFREIWPDLREGRLTPTPQDESRAVYYRKKAIAELDPIDLDAQYTGRELIDRLRARSFGDRGFAHFDVDGERYYVNLRIGRDSKFGGPA